MNGLKRADFPDAFRWGVSTSAYQVEGAADEDGRGPSIWDAFSHRPGAVKNGDNGDVACDHYHLWNADLERLHELGVNAYRFSVAWPRVQPEGRGAANAAGLDFYERVVDGLLARGIEPWLTLYHWDLPQALEDLGGWPNRDTAYRFVDYAAMVAERLGDRVKRWITHNEPWCAAFKGYMEGVFAPGRTDWAAASAACHHILLSHGLALPVLRELSPAAACGLSLVLNYTDAASDAPADLAAAARHDGLNFRWFVDPLYGRGYPADIAALLGPAAPPVRPGDLAAIATPTDFLGMNYYFRETVADAPEAGDPLRTRVVGRADAETTGSGWEIFPQGLTKLTLRLARDYGVGAIAITENGATWPDTMDATGRIADVRRIDYLRRHLRAVGEAIAGGAPVNAYFVWSLLDNFEWAEGYEKRFGLYYVDFATQERRMKESGRWYRRFLDGGAGA